MIEIVRAVMFLSTVGGVVLVFFVPLFLEENQLDEWEAFTNEKYLPMYVAMIVICFIVHLLEALK